MSTALDLGLDLELMLGDLPDIPCESRAHGGVAERDTHEGPATEYCRVVCPNCSLDVVRAYCAPLVAFMRSNGLVRCGTCVHIFIADRGVTFLGPVNGRAA